MTQREVYIDWLTGIAPWTTKLDMTFEWNCDQFRARRLFVNWMVKQLPSSSFLYAIERDPNQEKVANTRQGVNQACHVHAIADTDWDWLLKTKGTLRKDKWLNWKSRYGFCRIDKVRTIAGATSYALKKILNYSEKREDEDNHMRKTDVDWDLQWGKGKRAAVLKHEASKQGQGHFPWVT